MRHMFYIIPALVWALATPAIANSCANALVWHNHGYTDYLNDYRNNRLNPFSEIRRWNHPRTPPPECEQSYLNGALNASVYARNLEIPIF